MTGIQVTSRQCKILATPLLLAWFTEWQDAEVTEAPVLDFPIPPFGKEICHHSNVIKLHKVQESAGSDVGNKYPTRLYSKGWQGKLVPINVSTQLRVQNDRARHDWTKIKFRDAFLCWLKSGGTRSPSPTDRRPWDRVIKNERRDRRLTWAVHTVPRF